MERKYHFIKVEPADASILTKPGAVFQRKFDGVSSEVFVEDEISIIGRGALKGRNSDLTEKFPELVREIKALNLKKGTRFLPEIVIFKPSGAEDFPAIQTRTHRDGQIELFAKIHPARMIIHDVVSIGSDNVESLPYLQRLDALRPLVIDSTRLTMILNTLYGATLWKEIEASKFEGVVVRDPLAPLGERVWKIKREFTEDVFCTGGFEQSTSDTNSNLEYEVEGKKKKGVFANLTCYQLTGKNEVVKVCDVGTGFSNEDRKRIQAMLDLGLVTPSNPLVLEVKANARSDSLALRHPTFERIRDDKPWNECVIKNIK